MSIPQSMATITDGSSNTAAASEQLLGTSTTNTSSPLPLPQDTRRAFALDPSGGPTQAGCSGALMDGSWIRASLGGRVEFVAPVIITI